MCKVNKHQLREPLINQIYTHGVLEESYWGFLGSVNVPAAHLNCDNHKPLLSVRSWEYPHKSHISDHKHSTFLCTNSINF